MPFFAGKISVKGPGQKRSMSFSASGGTAATICASMARSATITAMGLSGLRPLSAPTRSTAAASSASAPSP